MIGVGKNRIMDIEKIKTIVNSNSPSEFKKRLILNEVAKDEKSLPNIIEILTIERENKKELLLDMNLELSRAHIYIDMFEPKKENKHFNKSFVLDEIAAFYIKHKGTITHCFNRFKTKPKKPTIKNTI